MCSQTRYRVNVGLLWLSVNNKKEQKVLQHMAERDIINPAGRSGLVLMFAGTIRNGLPSSPAGWAGIVR